MIFVDSSVWIDWFRGTPTPQSASLDKLLTSENVVVGDLVLAEVLQGVSRPAELERTRSVLLRQRLITISNVEVALQAAANHRLLRTLGVTPRSTVDTLIATRCIAEDWPLLASDRDFRPFADRLGLMLLG